MVTSHGSFSCHHLVGWGWVLQAQKCSVSILLGFYLASVLLLIASIYSTDELNYSDFMERFGNNHSI